MAMIYASCMKLKFCLLIAATLASPVHALSKDECLDFFTNSDVAIELLFHAINPKETSVYNDSFLDEKGNMAVYRHPPSVDPQVNEVEWWKTGSLVKKTKYPDVYPFDIYITKWPRTASRSHQTLQNNFTQELFCHEVHHDRYNSLYFCCLVDSIEKKQKIILETFKSMVPQLTPSSGMF